MVGVMMTMVGVTMTMLSSLPTVFCEPKTTRSVGETMVAVALRIFSVSPTKVPVASTIL